MPTPADYSARLSRIADELQAAIDARPELRSQNTGPRLTHSFLTRLGRVLADAAAGGIVTLPDCAADVQPSGRQPSGRKVDVAEAVAHLEKLRDTHRHYLIGLAAVQDRAAIRYDTDGEPDDATPGLLARLDPDHQFSENVAALGWPRAVLMAIRRLATAVSGDTPTLVDEHAADAWLVPLTDADIEIIKTLYEVRPKALIQVEIVVALKRRYDRDAVGDRLRKRLIPKGLVARPEGPRGGVALTDLGIMHAEHLAKTSHTSTT